MSTLLVLGATSDIARATARMFALNGWNIQLAGRDQAALSRMAQDIAVRTGKMVSCFFFDALQSDNTVRFWESLPERPEVVLCAVGLLGDQQTAQHDSAQAETIITTNFSGLIPVLSLAANHFEAQEKGCIIGISSVAGDRGRASNYIYGSAKAGLTAFLSGLRNRLARAHVHVMTVKPGFVATRMTKDMHLPPALTATPDEVAAAIWKGMEKKRNVVYVRPVWRFIMLAIRHIPENIFKFMKL